jgi:hypothetical protein
MERHLSVRRDDAGSTHQLPTTQADAAAMVGVATGTPRASGVLSMVTTALVSQHFGEEGLAVVLRPLTQWIILKNCP